LPLHPPDPEPERILLFGPPGSGKTTAWLDVAKWTARTKAPGRFFVLDTDFAVGRMLSSYREAQHIIDLHTGFDWADYESFKKTVMTQAGPNDWVVVDFIGSAWQAIQDHFVAEVHHQDIGSFFLQARKEMTGKGLAALEGWVDYRVINAMYFQWLNPILFKGRWNIFATAKTDQLSSDKKPTEDSQTRSLLLPFGVKPKAQKDILYGFHTTILTGRDPRSGARTLTAIKDRERSETRGQVVNSFTLDYLKGVAGWEMT
jgi:hypothetical protein